MNALLITRLVCLFALLFGTLIFGVLPLYVRRRLRCENAGVNCESNCRCRRGKKITTFLIFFGGGVLLGTTFLHLLPEAREGFDSKVADGDGKDHETFSMPEFIVCLGFFAVYFFEEIIHHFLGGDDHSHLPTDNLPTNININYGTHSITASIPSSGPGSEQSPSTPLMGDDPQVRVRRLSQLSLAAILTYAALSFHSFFEGFAVGLRPDAKSTWIVFIAVAIHKFVLAFVVGLQYVTDCARHLRKYVFVYVTIFALMSPIGIAVAIVTEINVEDSSPLTISVLNAIATGTLMYVTFFEILRGNQYQDLSSWGKFIATTVGFIAMALMQFGSTYA